MALSCSKRSAASSSRVQKPARRESTMASVASERTTLRVPFAVPYAELDTPDGQQHVAVGAVGSLDAIEQRAVLDRKLAPSGDALLGDDVLDVSAGRQLMFRLTDRKLGDIRVWSERT